jgi:hypothetical protein
MYRVGGGGLGHYFVCNIFAPTSKKKQNFKNIKTLKRLRMFLTKKNRNLPSP